MIDLELVAIRLTDFFRTRRFEKIEDVHEISETILKVYFVVYDPNLDTKLLGIAEIYFLQKRKWTIMNIDLFDKNGYKKFAWTNKFINI